MGDNKKVRVNRGSLKPITPGVVGIKTSHHEGALVCSTEFEIANSLDDVRGKVEAILRELADWVNVSGGIVGHIKAFISGQHSAALSTTGAEVIVKAMDPYGITTVNLAAIVFVEDEKGFVSKLAAAVHNIRQ